jgi:hypothetical protein
MKQLAIWAALLVLVAGCGKTDSEPKNNSGPEPTKETAELTPVPDMSAYSLGAPIQSGNLAVIPVVYKSTIKQTEDYATLAEAMKNDWIEILEMPGGQVDTLRVRNTGPKPLLLLGGELLVGGKQDRVLVKDVIVKPGETVEVSVNCVEHGRWTGDTDRFKAAETMVPMSVQQKARYEGQQEVWDEVGKYNLKAKASGERTTVRAGLENADVQKRVSVDLRKIADALGSQENVVGMIIAIDGQPQTLELFGSPSLFASSREVILKGALAEVALSGKSSSVAPKMSDCTAFFTDCLKADRRMKGIAGGINSFAADSSLIQGSEIGTRDYEAKPAAKQEGLVHGNYTRNPGK